MTKSPACRQAGLTAHLARKTKKVAVISLRSPEEYKRYRENVANDRNVLNEPFEDWRNRCIEEFKLWVMIRNNYPYDAVAEVHHLLIPRRVLKSRNDLTPEEREELEEIKKWAADRYDCCLENFPSGRSIKNHFHLHFLKYKYNEQISNG